MTFFQDMLTMAQLRDEYSLVVIKITVWIQEHLKGYFINTFISHIGH